MINVSFLYDNICWSSFSLWIKHFFLFQLQRIMFHLLRGFPALLCLIRKLFVGSCNVLQRRVIVVRLHTRYLNISILNFSSNSGHSRQKLFKINRFCGAVWQHIRCKLHLLTGQLVRHFRYWITEHVKYPLNIFTRGRHRSGENHLKSSILIHVHRMIVRFPISTKFYNQKCKRFSN